MDIKDLFGNIITDPTITVLDGSYSVSIMGDISYEIFRGDTVFGNYTKSAMDIEGKMDEIYIYPFCKIQDIVEELQLDVFPGDRILVRVHKWHIQNKKTALRFITFRKFSSTTAFFPIIVVNLEADFMGILNLSEFITSAELPDVIGGIYSLWCDKKGVNDHPELIRLSHEKIGKDGVYSYLLNETETDDGPNS